MRKFYRNPIHLITTSGNFTGKRFNVQNRVRKNKSFSNFFNRGFEQAFEKDLTFQHNGFDVL